MPKWTDYTTKTNPADNDEVMVLDTAGKANKRLGLSALSDWILNKLADKTFQKLATSNKTVIGAINALNSDLTAKVYEYTPSFSWSKGTVNPTVKNITAYFSQYGKVCFAYVRYNITDLGTFDKDSFLEITLPSGITSLVASASLVSPYQIVGSNTILGARVLNNKVIIVNGVGGDYSAGYIQKGYQGFSIFFIAK